MNLKGLFALVVVLELVLMVLVVYSLELNVRLKDRLVVTAENRFLMAQAADRLRQSSDDLTRFARNYVVTGDRMYRDCYYRILDIRNGRAPRPHDYYSIYWDYLEPLRSELHPDGMSVSLEKILASLPFTDEECGKLREARSNSDDLVGLEQEAFDAMEGVFRDENGKFTVVGKPDQEFAISCLHSGYYDVAKQKIMRPIDEFTIMVNERMRGEVGQLGYESRRNTIAFGCLVLLFVVSNAFILLKLHRRIIANVTHITGRIRSSRGGQFFLDPPGMKSNDELGVLVSEFNAMQEVIGSRTRMLERTKEELLRQRNVVDKYVVISETDCDGVITYASDAFCEISGYSKEELIGSTHSIVRSQNTPKSVFADMWSSLAEGKSWKGQLENVRKDGSPYWVKTAIEPILDRDGNRVGYRSIRVDVTEKIRVEKLSVTDVLTGLPNRLKLDEVFHYECMRSERYGVPFSIAILDVDHFKSVNDTYGHQVGDQLLKDIARLLADNVRAADTVGRWGGEEFLVICPETDLMGVADLAEKLRRVIGACDFRTVKSKTVSLGVTTFVAGDCEEAMMRRADEALYQAKEDGRNRVAALPGSGMASTGGG